jgi:hypothetical protein
MPHQEPIRDESLTSRVLHRIHSEHITPRPRWEFLLKNYIFWGIGVLSVLLGALSVSAIIFEVSHTEWELAFLTHPTFVDFFLDAAPFLWMLTFVLFIFIGYHVVRRTNYGYRYPLSIIAIGSVCMSLTLGVGLYAVGCGELIEEASEAYTSFHPSVVAKEYDWWATPSRGLLGGSVVSAATDFSSFDLLDFNGNVWHVEGADLRTPDITAVARGGVVRVIGLPTAGTSTVFHACFVFPWSFGGMFHDEPLPLLTSLSSTTGAQDSVRSASCETIAHYRELHTLRD